MGKMGYPNIIMYYKVLIMRALFERASGRADRSRYRILLVATALTPGLASAETSPEPKSMSLAPLEVTAGTPSPGKPLLQSASIDVLSGAEKDQRETATLGETLEHMTGVQSIGAGPQTGKPVIRGLSGNRIRILSNGIGVNHQQFGTRHSPNIDPFLSERIEAVRGASSLLYGSGALGGAIDVKPLSLEFAAPGEERLGGEGLTGYSSNNNQRDLGLRAFREGEAWSVTAGIIDRDAGDITTPDDTEFAQSNVNGDPKFTDELDFTDFDQTNAQLGVGHRNALGDFFVRYTGWRNEHNFLLPNGKGLGQNLENDEVQFNALLAPAEGWELEPTLSWQNNLRQSNEGGKPRKDLFDGAKELEFDQYTGRLEARHQSLGPFDGGTLGIEVMERDQESRGNIQLAPGGDVQNVALFAFEERSVGDLTVQAGIRHDWHETVGDASKTAAVSPLISGRDENQYRAVSGSIGGTYSLSPNLAVATNVSSGFRAPGLFELYADGKHAGVAAFQVGNPNLDEERSLNTDLALRWQSESLSASATVYHNRIDDYIFLQNTGDTREGLREFVHRQDDATLKGVELEVRGNVTPVIELGASYSAVNSENRETGEELPLQPADELRADATWSPGSWAGLQDPYLRLGVRHNAAKDAAPGEPFEQFDDKKPFGTASTDSYTVADLSAGFGIAHNHGEPVRLSLEVKNLTDESYRDFLDTYKGYALSPGRDFRLKLRVPFET